MHYISAYIECREIHKEQHVSALELYISYHCSLSFSSRGICLATDMMSLDTLYLTPLAVANGWFSVDHLCHDLCITWGGANVGFGFSTSGFVFGLRDM